MLTGKGVGWGGSLVRKEATGYGAVFFVRAMLEVRKDTLDGKTRVVSGSGKVAIPAIKKLRQLGAKVVACSDSNGVVVHDKGIDLAIVKRLKEVERRRIADDVNHHADARYIAGGNIRALPCLVAMPSATQDEIDGNDARTLLPDGCIAVGEGATKPTTPEGVKPFPDAGVAFGTGQAPTPAGWRPRRSRCSRTRAATPGPTSPASASSTRS